jgi:hypothetical protein
LLTL